MLQPNSVKLATCTFAGLIALAIALLSPASLHSAGTVVIAAATVSTSTTIDSPALPGLASTPSQKTTVANTKFRGYCECSCTNVPDCNSSADCGGAACVHFISCCEKPGSKGAVLAQNTSCNHSSRWKID